MKKNITFKKKIACVLGHNSLLRSRNDLAAHSSNGFYCEMKQLLLLLCAVYLRSVISPPMTPMRPRLLIDF